MSGSKIPHFPRLIDNLKIEARVYQLDAYCLASNLTTEAERCFLVTKKRPRLYIWEQNGHTGQEFERDRRRAIAS